MKYIINNSGIILFINNQPRKIISSELIYPSIIDALKLPAEQQEDKINSIINPISNNSSGFVIDSVSESVYYKESKLPLPLANKVKRLIKEALPVDLVAKFWDNLKLNPSNNSIEQLYDFLSYAELPLTEDGCFLAYKGLREDYYSVHGNVNTIVSKGSVDRHGRIYNYIGEVVEIPRNNCDDNRENQCSHGLHVGSFDYAKQWAKGKLVVVKVNPKDVVSVPKDHDCQKMRVCAYEVISEIPIKDESEILSVAVEGSSSISPLENVEVKEKTNQWEEFKKRIDNYLCNKKGNVAYVSLRQIQNSFSPNYPSKTMTRIALGDLGYKYHEKFKRVDLSNYLNL